jgi:hypothetical protein
MRDGVVAEVNSLTRRTGRLLDALSGPLPGMQGQEARLRFLSSETSFDMSPDMSPDMMRRFDIFRETGHDPAAAGRLN